jgi:hypothetical protein
VLQDAVTDVRLGIRCAGRRRPARTRPRTVTAPFSAVSPRDALLAPHVACDCDPQRMADASWAEPIIERDRWER